MDVPRTSGSPSTALASRLPTKKNSFHSLREAKESIERRALASSPSAASDQSSSSGGGANPDTLFASRRSSSSSQHSLADARGRPAAGRPQSTRIPRPSPSSNTNRAGQPTHRRPLSIKDAYRMAEAEEEAADLAVAAQGSPSPAPRAWRRQPGAPRGTPTPAAATRAAATPLGANESRMQKIMAQSPLDRGGRVTARRITEPLFPDRQDANAPGLPQWLNPDVNSTSNRVAGGGDRDQDRDRGADEMRRIQHEEDQARMSVAMGDRSGGLFSPKANISPKIAVAGQELHRRTSSGALGDRRSKVPVSLAAGGLARPSSPGRLSPRLSPSLSPRVSQAQGSARTRPPGSSYLRRVVSAQDGVMPAAGEGSSADLEGSSGGGDGPFSDTPAGTPLVDHRAQLAAGPPVPVLRAMTQEELIISSPGKSFAWDADEDFTARDLMVSDSPPVKTQGGSGAGDTPQGRPRNTKLDEIRQREIDADLVFPNDSVRESQSGDDAEPILPGRHLDADAADDSQAGDTAPAARRHTGLPPQRTNTRLDEIRALETEVGSRRARSEALINEIKQQNSEYRPPPVDPIRKISLEHLRAEMARDGLAAAPSPADNNGDAAASRTVLDEEGERIPNTPITIFRAKSADRGRKESPVQTADDSSDRDTAKNGSSSPGGRSRQSSTSSHSRRESQELLRKLARVTKTVAAAEQRDRDQDKPLPIVPGRLGERASSDQLRSTGAEKNPRLPRLRDADTLRPSVGFAQLRRVSSSESASTKRSSVAQSDSDPVDRIEAEMKLFAPTENHSERGSIRAPSPDDDDSGSGSKSSRAMQSDDATPKPARNTDPLLMPTPRVTGAFVETPVTQRTERMQEVIYGAAVPAPQQESAPKEPPEQPAEQPASNGATSAAGPSEAASRRPSVTRRKSRSRSTSRARQRGRATPPLTNSAQLVSAHDDLLAIQRAQQMDDSTVDDFDALLAKLASESAGVAANERATTARGGRSGHGADSAGDNDTVDPERLRRMSQSITTYIMDVQTAKKDLERLEDQVSQPGRAGRTVRADADELAVLGLEVEEEEMKLEAAEAVEASTTAVAVAEAKVKMGADDSTSNVLTRRHRHARQSSAVETEAKAVSGTAKGTASSSTSDATYAHIPVPRLHQQGAGSRLTLLGMLLVLLSVWLAAESVMCALYCRPETCGSGQACLWSPDDPWFGVAVPVKLDQWLTDGRGRVLAAWAGEELGDLAADAWDAATGTDIRKVNPTYYTFEEKRRYRRRLLKKGLVAPWTPPAELRPKLEAWRRAREAREQEEWMREHAQYEDDEHETRSESVSDGHGGWWWQRE